MSVASFQRGAILALGAALLAACSARGPSTMLPIATVPTSGAQAVFNLAPPKCKGQTTTASYAERTQKLSTAGGSICLPAFGGIGGSLGYGNVSPSISMTFTTSTTNYNGKLPSLSKGSPLFYLQIRTSGAATFGKSTPAGSSVAGAAFTPGKAFTSFAELNAGSITIKPSCYVVATAGKYGGVLSFTAVFKGAKFPAAVSAVFEVYPGKRASRKC